MAYLLEIGLRRCQRRCDKDDIKCTIIKSTEKEHESQMDLSKLTNNKQNHWTNRYTTEKLSLKILDLLKWKLASTINLIYLQPNKDYFLSIPRVIWSILFLAERKVFDATSRNDISKPRDWVSENENQVHGYDEICTFQG